MLIDLSSISHSNENILFCGGFVGVYEKIFKNHLSASTISGNSIP